MILNIPEELLLKIFSYLTTQDLLRNVALVNRKFQKVAMDADLLKIIVLKDIDEHVYQEAENVLMKARRLQKLTFKQNVLGSDHLIKAALKTSQNLKTLAILGKISEDFALSLCENGQQLEHLDFSKMRTAIDYSALMHLTTLKNLKTLKISSFRCPFQTEHIQSLTSNCQLLEGLEFPIPLSNTHEILEELSKVLKSTLRRLTLYCPSEIQWTFESLSTMEKLTTLDITTPFNLKFTEDQITNLAKIPLLEEFSLIGQWFFTDEMIENLVQLFTGMKIENMKSLTVEINCNPSARKILKIIALRVGARLQKLKVQCCFEQWCNETCPTSIGFDLADVSAILKKCTYLKELTICGKELPQTLLWDIVNKHGINLKLDKISEKALKRYSKTNLEPSGITITKVQKDFVLPQKALLKVFQCLSTPEILQSIALVCKQFYRISKDPRLYYSVTFENIDDHDLESIEVFLTNATKVKQLILKNTMINKEILLSKTLQHCKELKIIQIWSRLTQDSAKLLVDQGSHIEHLDMMWPCMAQ